MKSFFGVFAALLCFISISTGVLAEAWEDETRGITESEFITIALDCGKSDDIYLGTNIALYRMKDAKGAWEELFLTKGEFKGVNYIYSDGNRI